MKRFLIYILFTTISGCFFSLISQVNSSLRKQKLLDFAADIYQPPKPTYSDPEKVYWPVTIARFTKYGINDSLANAYLNRPEFITKEPFHFILVGMARLMPLFSDAPSMKIYKLTYLDNIYNVTNSYNPWTCEGTENHINMSRTSGYIFAEIMEQHPKRYPNASEYKKIMKDWIHWYSKRIYEVGTGEFNASTYGIYNLIGWLNLFDFATDPEVKIMARAVLDYYATEIALHYTQGMTGGSESRGAPSKKSLSTETDILAWYWFGDGPDTLLSKITFINNSKLPLQCVHAATSNYQPPIALTEVAQKKQIDSPHYYSNSKPSYLLGHSAYIKQNFYISKNFTLGTSYYPYGAFTTAAYKNTTWKLISKVETGQGNQPELVTGGGMFYNDFDGKIRNPWLQTIQHKNVLIQLNMMPKNAEQLYKQALENISKWDKLWHRDFIKRFGKEDVKILNQDLHPVQAMKNGNPSSTGNGCYIRIQNPHQTENSADWLFIELENTYLLINALHGVAELSSQNIVSDSAPLGNMSGLIMEVFEKNDFSSFQEFRQLAIEKTKIISFNKVDHSIQYQTFMGDTIEAIFGISGTYTEPIYDWGYGPVTPQVFQTSPPFTQPEWPSGDGNGRIALWSINGFPVELSEKWPVYNGPQVKLDNSKLTISTKQHDMYTVDYSGELPHFSSNIILKNKTLKLSFNTLGGMIDGIWFENNPVNPLNWKLSLKRMPENNKAGAPFMGHFTCYGRWGAPTEGEINAGVPHNGGLSNSTWEFESKGQYNAVFTNRSDLDLMSAQKIITIDTISPLAVIKDIVKSESTIGRLNNIVQHPTIAPPFLNSSTKVFTNATKGFFQDHSFPDPYKFEYLWPVGKDSNNTSINLTSCSFSGNYVTTHIFEDKTGWVCCYDPVSGLLLGYIFNTIEYPWLNVWHQTDNTGQPSAKGIEFGTTGIGRPYQDLIFKDLIYYGRHSYEFLDALDEIEKTYCLFISNSHEKIEQINSINMIDNNIVINFNSNSEIYLTISTPIAEQLNHLVNHE